MSSSTGINPFPGIRPFDIQEKYLFFGREDQTAELLTRLRKTRFLAVVGSSGSGKSSLVRAGLIPELHGGTMAAAGSSWEVAVMKPGGDPLTNLAQALIDADLYDPDQDDVIPMVRACLSRSGMGLVDAVQQSDLEPKTNLLLVVDQFEEIFRFRRMTGISEEEAGHFIRLLLEASQDPQCPIFVVLTMRSDFLGDCAQFGGLAEAVNEGEYIIPRLNRSQRKRAIEAPARVGGREMSNRLVQRLLNDISDDPDQLPILQHALMRTWDYWVKAGSEGPVDLEHYQATGGMAEALSRHADEVFESLPDEEHRRIATKLFKSLTEKVSENRGIRRPMQLNELHEICGGNMDHLLHVINEFRKTGCTFLMPAGESELQKHTIIDISHESLMRVWRSLCLWVDDEAQSAKIYRRLADTANLYKAQRAGLYRDPDLGIALAWREENQPNQTWADRYYPGFVEAMTFLDQSQEEAEREAREKEEARKRELAQARALAREKARSARLFKVATLGISFLLLVAAYAAWDAIQSRNQVALKIVELAKRSLSTAETLLTEKKHADALVWLADAIELAQEDPNSQNGYIRQFNQAMTQMPLMSSTYQSTNNIRFSIPYTESGAQTAIYSTQIGGRFAEGEQFLIKRDLATGEEKIMATLASVAWHYTYNERNKILVLLERSTSTYRAFDCSSGTEIASFKSPYGLIFFKLPHLILDNGLLIAPTTQGWGAGGQIVIFDIHANRIAHTHTITGTLMDGLRAEGNEIHFLTKSNKTGNYEYETIDLNDYHTEILYISQGEQGVLHYRTEAPLYGMTIELYGDNFVSGGNQFAIQPERKTYFVVRRGNEEIYRSETFADKVEMRLAPNQKTLILRSWQGFVKAFDLPNLKTLWERQLSGLDKSATFTNWPFTENLITLSPDGNAILLRSENNQLQIIDNFSGRPVFQHDYQLNVQELLWAKEGTAFHVLTGSKKARDYVIPNPLGKRSTQDITTPKQAHDLATYLSGKALDGGNLVFDKQTESAQVTLETEFKELVPTDKLTTAQQLMDMAVMNASDNRWWSVRHNIQVATKLGNPTQEHEQYMALAEANLSRLEAFTPETAQSLITKSHELNVPKEASSFDHFVTDQWYISPFYVADSTAEPMVTDLLDQQTLTLKDGANWQSLHEAVQTVINPNDLNEAFSLRAPENSIYYVLRFFDMPNAGTVSFKLSSGDYHRSWINEQLVASSDNIRVIGNGYEKGSAYVPAGRSYVLMKVYNEILNSGFQASLDSKSSQSFGTNIASYIDQSTPLSPKEIATVKLPSGSLNREALTQITMRRLNSDEAKGLLAELKSIAEVEEAILPNKVRDSYIKVTKKLSDQSHKSGFTWSCFYKRPLPQPDERILRWGSAHHLISCGGTFDSPGISLALFQMVVGDKLMGVFFNDDTDEVVTASSPYTFNDDWNHIALVYSSEQSAIIIYLNGEKATEWVPISSEMALKPQDLTIGASSYVGHSLGGLISDIKITQKQITQNEINAYLEGDQSIFDDCLLDVPLVWENVPTDVVPTHPDLEFNHVSLKPVGPGHPLHEADDLVASVGSSFHYDLYLFRKLGIVFYRAGIFDKALENLIRGFNFGKFNTSVKLDLSGRYNGIDALFLALAYQRNGMIEAFLDSMESLRSDFADQEVISFQDANEPNLNERLLIKELWQELEQAAAQVNQ